MHSNVIRFFSGFISENCTLDGIAGWSYLQFSRSIAFDFRNLCPIRKCRRPVAHRHRLDNRRNLMCRWHLWRWAGSVASMFGCTGLPSRSRRTICERVRREGERWVLDVVSTRAWCTRPVLTCASGSLRFRRADSPDVRLDCPGRASWWER